MANRVPLRTCTTAVGLTSSLASQIPPDPLGFISLGRILFTSVAAGIALPDTGR